MKNKLRITASPHLHKSRNISLTMLCVLLALAPAACAGCFYFGLRAAMLLGITVAAAMLAELIAGALFRRPGAIFDLSAAVTGLLLGMSLPPTFPLIWAAVGSAGAVFVVKQMFGGIGRNFANPALTAKAVLLLCFMTQMYTWTVPGTGAVITGTTPQAGATWWDLFLGNTPGCIGETCAAALLCGCIFLMLAGIISPALPISFLGSFAALCYIQGCDTVSQLLSGGLMLGACFMANDYATCPLTTSGKVLFGLCCGSLTFLIRQYGGFTDGTGLAILIMNLFVPLIDRITAQRPFGGVRYRTMRKATAK